VRLDRRAVLVLCADNGVLSEGVAQSGPEITGLVAGAVAQGGASVSQMAKVANAAVVTVDMGIFEPVAVPDLLDRRIAPGTGNIAVGPAMTREQALQAIQTGIELVRLQKEEFRRLLSALRGSDKRR
jgi:nicotinate-nucleotide--dimethylbenzimidazole phosphoribosyltransferase